jgi:hypothetical protein
MILKPVPFPEPDTLVRLVVTENGTPTTRGHA